MISTIYQCVFLSLYFIYNEVEVKSTMNLHCASKLLAWKMNYVSAQSTLLHCIFALPLFHNNCLKEQYKLDIDLARKVQVCQYFLRLVLLFSASGKVITMNLESSPHPGLYGSPSPPPQTSQRRSNMSSSHRSHLSIFAFASILPPSNSGFLTQYPLLFLSSQ